MNSDVLAAALSRLIGLSVCMCATARPSCVACLSVDWTSSSCQCAEKQGDKRQNRLFCQVWNSVCFSVDICVHACKFPGYITKESAPWYQKNWNRKAEFTHTWEPWFNAERITDEWQIKERVVKRIQNNKAAGRRYILFLLAINLIRTSGP